MTTFGMVNNGDGYPFSCSYPINGSSPGYYQQLFNTWSMPGPLTINTITFQTVAPPPSVTGFGGSSPLYNQPGTYSVGLAVGLSSANRGWGPSGQGYPAVPPLGAPLANRGADYQQLYSGTVSYSPCPEPTGGDPHSTAFTTGTGFTITLSSPFVYTPPAPSALLVAGGCKNLLLDLSITTRGGGLNFFAADASGVMQRLYNALVYPSQADNFVADGIGLVVTFG